MPTGRTLAEWLSYQQALHPRSIDLGLERVRAVADRLGLLPPAGRVAVVAGTIDTSLSPITTDTALSRCGMWTIFVPVMSRSISMTM